MAFREKLAATSFSYVLGVVFIYSENAQGRTVGLKEPAPAAQYGSMTSMFLFSRLTPTIQESSSSDSTLDMRYTTLSP
jgi:hypothetical protein